MKKILLVCCLFIALSSAAFAQKNTVVTDPAEKAKGLQKELKLTDDQTSKIAAIYKESSEKFDKIKKEEHGNTDKMLVAIRPLRTETIKKIKAQLTPAQKIKYDKLVKDNKGGTSNGWSDGWSGASAGK
jgi:Spy/CpxP family protein refolding chaperone